jgi:tetratricopeptide (TPR) repeat protein
MHTISCIEKPAEDLLSNGDFQEAGDLFEQVLQAESQIFDAGPGWEIDIPHKLEYALFGQSRFREAADMLKTAFEACSKLVTGLNDLKSRILISLGWSLYWSDQVIETESLFNENLESISDLEGWSNPYCQTIVYELIEVFKKQEKYQAAEALMRSAIHGYSKDVGEDSEICLVMMLLLGTYLLNKRLADAKPILQDHLTRRILQQKKTGKNHEVIMVRNMLSAVSSNFLI